MKNNDCAGSRVRSQAIETILCRLTIVPIPAQHIPHDDPGPLVQHFRLVPRNSAVWRSKKPPVSNDRTALQITAQVIPCGRLPAGFVLVQVVSDFMSSCPHFFSYLWIPFQVLANAEKRRRNPVIGEDFKDAPGDDRVGTIVKGEVNSGFALNFTRAIPREVAGDCFQNGRGFREVHRVGFGLHKLAESQRPSERSRALTLRLSI